MKNWISYFMVVLLFVTACTIVDEGDQTPTDGGNGNPSIELGTGVEQEIILEADGGSEIIRFTSSQSWYIESPEDAPWLQLSPVEGEPGDGRVKVKAESNTSGVIRRAEFKVCSGTLSVKFSVIQDNYDLVFEIPETEMHISGAGGLIPIPINTNQDFLVESAQDWVIPIISQAKMPENIVVAVEPNLTSSTRTSDITVSCDLGEVTITVTQDSADGLLSQWTDKSFVSRSLAMRFTATWCGYCPQMSAAFDSAKEQMKGALEIVNLHTYGSDYEFSGTDQLERRFGVSNYPTGIVDLRAFVSNNSQAASIAMQIAQETKNSYPSVAGISVDSYLSGTDLTVVVPIYFHKPDRYRVTVLLLEDDIVGEQAGAGSQYTHNDIARKALTSMSGDPVNIISANTVKTLTYTTKVRSEWNSDNLKVLVYVERPYGDLPLATGVSGAKYINNDETFIDNCRSVMVGEDAAVELQ